MFQPCRHVLAATGDATRPIYKHACGSTYIFPEIDKNELAPAERDTTMPEADTILPITTNGLTKTMGINDPVGATWTITINEPNPVIARFHDPTVDQAWAIKYAPFAPCHIIANCLSRNMVVAMSVWGGSIFTFKALNRTGRYRLFFGYTSRPCLCDVNDVTMQMDGVDAPLLNNPYPLGIQTFPMIAYVTFAPAVGLRAVPVNGTYDYASHIEYDLNMCRQTLRGKYGVIATDAPFLPLDYVVSMHRDTLTEITTVPCLRDRVPDGINRELTKFSCRAHHALSTEYGYVGPIKGFYALPGDAVVRNYACGLWFSDIAAAYEFAMTLGATKSISATPQERINRGLKTVSLVDARDIATNNGIADYQNGLLSLSAQRNVYTCSSVFVV